MPTARIGPRCDHQRAGMCLVCVSATVSLGSISATTPYVKSFNINLQRGSAGTASASLKVPAASIFSAGGPFSISTNTGGSNPIFTGRVTRASITPCFDDPAYVILNVSAEDDYEKIKKGAKFSRRFRTKLGTWATIDGVNRRGDRGSSGISEGGSSTIGYSGSFDIGSIVTTSPLNYSSLSRAEAPRGAAKRDVVLSYNYIDDVNSVE